MELRGASEVHAATFQYDHPGLQSRLLRCLRGGLRLDLVVDGQGSSTCRGMKARLLELKQAGGKVWLCDGHNHQAVYGPAGAHLTGHMHNKIVVVDKRIGYLGSMNLNRSALTNKETICKFKGPVVQDLLQAVLACRRVLM
jgi:phosphatidylserine/phosphatidylglycerophosphate/cardiolipin synthase-like enzyme